jgi:hypothetical protein
MPRAMKALAGAALVLVLAACQSKPDPVNGANAIFKAPKATTGSGIDPETQGPVSENETGVEPTKPAATPENSFQFKEILADPKDFRSRIDLVRTLLGEEWLPVSKTPKGNGVILWKFMRRDAGRIDADPFGLPDLTKEPPKKLTK